MSSDQVPSEAQEGVRTADVLGAFSLASDLATGLHAEHGARSCYIGMELAEALGLSADDRIALFYAELLKDVGCTAYTSQLASMWLADELAARRDLFFFREKNNPLDLLNWATEYIASGANLGTRTGRILDFLKNGREAMREGFASTCVVASRVAERLGMPVAVQQALLHVFDQWDGKGILQGAQGQAIPIVSRIVLFTSFLDVFLRVGGRDAAEQIARERRGTAFDPEVVDAFLAIARDEAFWSGLEAERIWDRVLALEPVVSPYRYIPSSQLDEVALSFADFADMKAPHLIGHSRRVAEVAQSIGRALSLSDERLVDLYRAGLVYDIGLVAVPSFILTRPHEHLTDAEREQYRLHPYHSRRIMARVPAFAGLLPALAAHHERPDGRGYPAGVTAAQISQEARILAVADRFDAITHDTPEGPALTTDEAVASLRSEAGTAFAAEIVEALAAVFDTTGVARQRPPATAVGGLTPREVQVLRLIATGQNRKQVATALVVSEGTVRSHLEHIYSKIGVSNRAGATLFAMEHGLLE